MGETTITDHDGLRARYGKPGELVQRKVIGRLDKHCRRFIAASPFLVLASTDASGAADASPRGDPPGFVAVLDDHHLAIPDRPGNRRVDSLRNILENPQIGLIFFVPGVNETLRVNGRAAVSTDPELLAKLAVKGKAPISAIVVTVEEAFLHCAKALIRSDLWNPETRVERTSLPTLGEMLADQIEGVTAEAADRTHAESIAKRLY